MIRANETERAPRGETMDRTALIAATRRLRASSTEIADLGAAAKALGRMAYLWAWSVRLGRVLDDADLDEAIRSFWSEFPNGAVDRDGLVSRSTRDL